MGTSIFVNIAVTDLARAKAFYTALGFSINPTFSDEKGACIVVDENVFFMVLLREYFATFTDKTIADPRTTAQVLIALSRDSRAAVDEAIAAGIAGGGREPKVPEDLGFMYSRDLEDPDGNGVEFFFMEPAAIEAGPDAFVAERAGEDGEEGLPSPAPEGI